MRSFFPFLCLFVLAATSPPLHADDDKLHQFDRQQLNGTYYSEGTAAGDINGDGVPDVVYGPHWYEGPEFTTAHEIYPPVPQNMERYADHFFAWIYDFNADKHADIFVVGFPGTPAYVYENPGPDKLDEHWTKHEVFDWVSNESPQLISIVGDDRPELVCTRDGFFGYATIDWADPFKTWTFHPVSEKVATPKFGHGLGIGDIDGDGRADIIHSDGWFQQPAENPDSTRWVSHPAKFTNAYGGAEMYAYDVDGDGDSDVITSLAAHDFGLAWYEQTRDGDVISFEPHLIMGATPDENRYGVVFSELHSVNLADMDGDGLKDIVTGKTYYSHHKQSPMWNAGEVVYWFKLVRGKDGVDWIPYQADAEAGIGRQLVVFDLDGDKQLDIVTGGMKGCHVLKHRTETVDQKTWEAAQPVVRPVTMRDDRGKLPRFDRAGNKVIGALEGEDLTIVSVSEGKTSVQAMSGFQAGQWSGDKQLFWTGGKPGAKLTLKLEPGEGGKFDLSAAFTIAGDYGTIKLALDGEPLGPSIDLFNGTGVKTTGEIPLGQRELTAGSHELTIEITGTNEAAVKKYMVGLDFVRLEPVR